MVIVAPVSYVGVMTDVPEPTETDISEPSETSGAEVPSPRRLRRSMNDKVVAGVARGLGDRFDVDANIFRVIFVVLACLWGLGVAIYLAMWVFVPRAEGEAPTTSRRIHPPASTSRRLSIVVLVGVVVALVMLALLAIGGHHGHIIPSLGLLWLAFLIALAVVALRTSARRLTLRRLFAVVFLAGLSVLILVVGAFVAFLDSTGVSIAGGNGAHVWQPTTLSDVQHHYTTEFGATTVDLSAVTFSASGYVVNASTAAGTVRVLVPGNAEVSVTTHVGIGSVGYYQGSTEVSVFVASPSPGLSVTQLRRAPHLTLNAQVGIGRITILRVVAQAHVAPSASGIPSGTGANS